LTGMIKKVTRKVFEAARNSFGPEPEWRRRKRSVDRDFDSAHGLDTGGITQLKELGVSRDAWSEGGPHIAADPVEFSEALASIELDLSKLTFVDFGSGKGRALLLAAAYPFQRIIGVEFAEPLVATARKNIERYGETHDVSRIEVVHSDALKYDLPNEPELVFLYNPFGPSMMKVVAERTRASLERAQRDLIVLYLNPFHVEAWIQTGFTQIKRGDHFAVLEMKGGEIR
jgi:SAM-dependent methyltransferase